MPLPRPATPRALCNDVCAFWRQRPRHQWLAGTLAVAIPIGIVAAFYVDSYTNIVPRERVIYVHSWPATRTDAEIKAKQKADLADLRRRQAERQRQLKEIDDGLRRLGI